MYSRPHIGQNLFCKGAKRLQDSHKPTATQPCKNNSSGKLDVILLTLLYACINSGSQLNVAMQSFCEETE